MHETRAIMSPMPRTLQPPVPFTGPIPQAATIEVDALPSRMRGVRRAHSDYIHGLPDRTLSDLEYFRQFKVPYVIKLALDQFNQREIIPTAIPNPNVVPPVRSAFDVQFQEVRSLGQAVYDSALSGAFLADESKAFAESLKRLIPTYTQTWGARAYTGTLDFVDEILPEYKKCKKLREFAYIGIQSLAQLDRDRQALVTTEYKVFSEWMNFASSFINQVNVLIKNSPEIFTSELNAFLEKFETQIQARGELTGDAVHEEQVLFAHLQKMKEAVAAFSGDANSMMQSLRVISDETKRSTSPLLKKYGSETQRKALQDIINIFVKTLEECFPAIFAYEQALLTWTTINAKRAAELKPDTDKHIKFAIRYFETAVDADVKYFGNLSNTIRLNKTLQMVKHRALLKNGMILPEHVKAWLAQRGVSGEDMVALPLDDRSPQGHADDKLAQADASYRNIDPKPMRFYVPALQTAIMWLTPERTYHDTEGTSFDWNQNPWNFILTPDDQGLIVFGHGTSAEYSNSNAVLAAAEAMAYSEKPGAARQRKRGVLMYDQIEHGFGPLYQDQEEPKNHQAYRRNVLDLGAAIIKEHDKKGATMGRSFAANESIDTPLLYPDLFGEGAVYFASAAMSPYLKEWVPYTMQSLVEHQVVLNTRGDRWSSLIEPHWMFEQDRDSQEYAVPTMLTYSPDDIEYPPAVIEQWKNQFGNREGYLVASFPGGYHDLFNRNDPFMDNKDGDPFIAHATRHLYDWYWDEVFAGQKPTTYSSELVSDLQSILDARTRQAFIMGLLHDTTPTDDAVRNSRIANRIHRRQLIEVPAQLRNDYFEALRNFARLKLSLIIQSASDSAGKDQKKKRSAADLASQIQELRNTVRNRVCQYLKARFFQAQYEDAEWINLDIPADIADFLWAHLPAALISKFPEALAIEESGRFAGTQRLSGRDFDALLDGKYHKSINRKFYDRFVAFIEASVSELLETALNSTDSEQLNPIAADLVIMTESLAKSYAPAVFMHGTNFDEFESLKQDPTIQALSAILHAQLKTERVVVNGSILTFGREIPRDK